MKKWEAITIVGMNSVPEIDRRKLTQDPCDGSDPDFDQEYV